MSLAQKIREALAPSHTPEDVSRNGHACFQEGDALARQLDLYTKRSPSFIDVWRGEIKLHFNYERCDALMAEADAILETDPDVHFVMHAQRIPLSDARNHLAAQLATVEEFRPNGKR
jgi:hypothetical protein